VFAQYIRHNTLERQVNVGWAALFGKDHLSPLDASAHLLNWKISRPSVTTLRRLRNVRWMTIFETSHGKSVYDGIGATVKWKMARASLQATTSGFLVTWVICTITARSTSWTLHSSVLTKMSYTSMAKNSKISACTKSLRYIVQKTIIHLFQVHLGRW